MSSLEAFRSPQTLFEEFDEIAWLGNWKRFNGWVNEILESTAHLDPETLVAFLCILRHVDKENVKKRSDVICKIERDLIGLIGLDNTNLIINKIS